MDKWQHERRMSSQQPCKPHPPRSRRDHRDDEDGRGDHFRHGDTRPSTYQTPPRLSQFQPQQGGRYDDHHRGSNHHLPSPIHHVTLLFPASIAWALFHPDPVWSNDPGKVLNQPHPPQATAPFTSPRTVTTEFVPGHASSLLTGKNSLLYTHDWCLRSRSVDSQGCSC